VFATLVLLDLRMPRLGGIDAARLIRAIPRYAKVPIVMLTVFNGETVKREALRAGATSFVAKPFSRAELLRVINPLIEAHKQVMELERH
jgi:CheY-like chemotaxis protein